VFPATGKTSYRATQAPDSRKLLTAIRTAIDEPRCVGSRRKRQIVTALLVGDSQVDTGLPPLRAMGQNPTLSRAKLGKKMSKLVPQSAIDFGRMLD
jgi:hypothetical protein